MSYAKNSCPECGSSLVERDGRTMKLCKFVVMNGSEILVITISGHPGSGTSTLVDGICNHFHGIH